jgi:hypothetical protein
MAQTLWTVDSIRLFDLIIISNLTIWGVIIYWNRSMIGTSITKLFIPSTSIAILSFLGWLDRESLINLIQGPPGYSWIIAFALYYLTVLSTSFKEKVDVFKIRVDDIVAVEKKNSETTKRLNEQLKSLKVKFIGVNKVAQTLERTSKTLDDQVLDLGKASKALTKRQEAFATKQDELVRNQEAFATKQDELVTEVSEIKELLKQILSRLPN